MRVRFTSGPSRLPASVTAMMSRRVIRSGRSTYDRGRESRRGLLSVSWIEVIIIITALVCCYHDASGQSSEHGFVQVEGSVGGGDDHHAVLGRAQTVPLLHQRRLHGGEGAMGAVVAVLAGRQHRVHLVEVDHAGCKAPSKGEDGFGVLLTLAKPLVLDR